MLEILRNMARRKMRTGLTVFGIVIGIFALTVMGSMTEYFSRLVDNAANLLGTTISVTPKVADLESFLTPLDQRQIERLPGVQDAIPLVDDTLEELPAVSLSVPDLVFGVPPENSHDLVPNVTLAQGRWLERGDDYNAVIGSKIAKKRNLSLGGTVTWKERDFTVVGIMNPTQTSPDSYVIISIDTARRLLKSPDLIVGLQVVPQPGADPSAVAQEIRDSLDNVSALTPQEAVNQTRQSLASFYVIMVGGAVLAALVGGVAVINTMIMSVHERKREIGLKKAIGASNGEIISEYVSEAALIGFIGGLVGFFAGWGMADLLNLAITASETADAIFIVTPRLAGVALAFAVLLGAFAGLYPAWNAARLDPVKALRGE